jgi:hypothetical protein
MSVALTVRGAAKVSQFGTSYRPNTSCGREREPAKGFASTSYGTSGFGSVHRGRNRSSSPTSRRITSAAITSPSRTTRRWPQGLYKWSYRRSASVVASGQFHTSSGGMPRSRRLRGSAHCYHTSMRINSSDQALRGNHGLAVWPSALCSWVRKLFAVACLLTLKVTILGIAAIISFCARSRVRCALLASAYELPMRRFSTGFRWFRGFLRGPICTST